MKEMKLKTNEMRSGIQKMEGEGEARGRAEGIGPQVLSYEELRTGIKEL